MKTCKQKIHAWSWECLSKMQVVGTHTCNNLITTTACPFMLAPWAHGNYFTWCRLRLIRTSSIKTSFTHNNYFTGWKQLLSCPHLFIDCPKTTSWPCPPNPHNPNPHTMIPSPSRCWGGRFGGVHGVWLPKIRYPYYIPCGSHPRKTRWFITISRILHISVFFASTVAWGYQISVW